VCEQVCAQTIKVCSDRLGVECIDELSSHFESAAQGDRVKIAGAEVLALPSRVAVRWDRFKDDREGEER